jgi:hypothetical protein
MDIPVRVGDGYHHAKAPAFVPSLNLLADTAGLLEQEAAAKGPMAGARGPEMMELHPALNRGWGSVQRKTP